jgi:hypothetical protein
MVYTKKENALDAIGRARGSAPRGASVKWMGKKDGFRLLRMQYRSRSLLKNSFLEGARL